MKEIKCEACRTIFKLSQEDEDKIKLGKNEGSKFIELRCYDCGIRINYNPTDEEILPLDPSGKTTEEYYNCPTRNCEGIVIEVEDFWGCGTCGNVWKSEEKLKKKIENQKVNLIQKLLRRF